MERKSRTFVEIKPNSDNSRKTPCIPTQEIFKQFVDKKNEDFKFKTPNAAVDRINRFKRPSLKRTGAMVGNALLEYVKAPHKSEDKGRD